MVGQRAIHLIKPHSYTTFRRLDSIIKLLHCYQPKSSIAANVIDIYVNNVILIYYFRD